METVVLVLCRLGVFHSSPLGLYFLTAKSNYSSPVFLGAEGYGLLLYYALFYCGLYGFDLYKNFTSNKPINGLSLHWIILLIGIITVFQSAYFSNYILGITSYTAAPVMFAIGLYRITIAVLKNIPVFLADIKQKYQNLTGEDLKEFRKKIQDVMESKRPFPDNNFSLKKLSEMASIPQHVLSRTFSMEFRETFTNFINRYRIGESKRILREPEKEYRSIAGIAFESGFNSISCFTSHSKKIWESRRQRLKRRPMEHFTPWEVYDFDSLRAEIGPSIPFLETVTCGLLFNN
ncbi:MAG: hypothetical protein C0490_06710 [Marivirga sp.]|nr:hypothetical protein [Marivirga sp.]